MSGAARGDGAGRRLTNQDEIDGALVGLVPGGANHEHGRRVAEHPRGHDDDGGLLTPKLRGYFCQVLGGVEGTSALPGRVKLIGTTTLSYSSSLTPLASAAGFRARS
jgi:hypothetical protein